MAKTTYFTRPRDSKKAITTDLATYTKAVVTGETLDIQTSSEGFSIGIDAGASIVEGKADGLYVISPLTVTDSLNINVGLGADEVVNGTFAADSDWTKGTGWTITSGQARKASGANTAALQPSAALVPVSGYLYRLQFDIASYASGSLVASFGGASGATVSADGTYIQYLLASDGSSNLVFTPATSTALRVDNVSLKKVCPIGASQVCAWVEDFGGTADKAALYFRTEDGYIYTFGTPTTLATAALTSITHTAPSTPDYAIQDLTNSSGYGFVTKDEGNTVLSVVLNLQARVLALETVLRAVGIVV